jgi:hypothetical protein
MNREAQVNITPVAGGRRDLSGMIRNASNVAFVMYFVRKDVSSKQKKAFSKRIWITARDAVSARMNAGRKR